MSKITFTESSILFQMRDETILFEPYGPDTIRVRATRNGTFSEEKWTLLDPLPAECTVEGDEHHARSGPKGVGNTHGHRANRKREEIERSEVGHQRKDRSHGAGKLFGIFQQDGPGDLANNRDGQV